MKELSPLNCSGSSEEEVGREMSNLAHRPFQFRGRLFASVEAFYIGLKTLDETLRVELATLHGGEAKRRGKKLSAKNRLTRSRFDGAEFELGGPEHHALVKEAIREKLLQHRDLLVMFVQTRPRRIIHDTGWPESRFTQLPAVVFCDILSELREELAEVVTSSER